MSTHFLQRYAALYNSIPGYFTLEAALLFIAYNQLVAAHGITGDVLEIGVHHGRSAIVVGSFPAHGRKFVAVDLFDKLQELNSSASGSGNQESFLSNMKQFFDDLSFLTTIEGLSSTLSVETLGNQFAFCHIDGGHSPEETYNDLDLCCQLLKSGGLLVLDDYFNPAFPGVSEGAVQFKLEHGDQLTPIAIGFNKVIFQKKGTDINLGADFSSAFPMIPHDRSVLWGQPVNHFTISITSFIDLVRSTPQSLTPSEGGWVQALIEPRTASVAAGPGETITLSVAVTNKSEEPLPYGDTQFGLSYHILTDEGAMVRFDNSRTYFQAPLQPGRSLVVDLPVKAPTTSGSYAIELDLVWEGMLWFKESGNPTAMVELIVR